MTIQSLQATFLNQKFAPANRVNRVYAPATFEQQFDTLSPVRQPLSPHHPATGTGTRVKGLRVAGPMKSRPLTEDVAALKAAQLVAEELAHDARQVMADFGAEFDAAAHVRHTARSAANMMATTLQPLPRKQRHSVVERAVDPAYAGEDVDVVLDGVGQALSVYSQYLPDLTWLPVPTGPGGTVDARVVGWRNPSGMVVLDLLDTTHNCHHVDEVADVLGVAARPFGGCLVAVRYLPTFRMCEARLYYPDGRFDMYRHSRTPEVVPLPTLAHPA